MKKISLLILQLTFCIVAKAQITADISSKEEPDASNFEKAASLAVIHHFPSDLYTEELAVIVYDTIPEKIKEAKEYFAKQKYPHRYIVIGVEELAIAKNKYKYFLCYESQYQFRENAVLVYDIEAHQYWPRSKKDISSIVFPYIINFKTNEVYMKDTWKAELNGKRDFCYQNFLKDLQ